jgi:hypothetical protein
MTRKYEVGEVLSLETAIIMQNEGLAVIVTDGKFVEIDKED